MSPNSTSSRALARLLIIGQGAAALAATLGEHSGDLLTVEATKLPAQGIRLFEQTPPDALLLLGGSQGAATRALVSAISSRPLGQLIPIIVMSHKPDSVATTSEIAKELGVNAWLPRDTSAYHVLSTLAEALDLTELVSQPLPESSHLGAPPPIPPRFDPEQMLSQETAPTREVMVSLDPGDAHLPGTQPAVARMDRHSLFPVRANPTKDGELSEEMVRRKLKEVRHEDYYTILEVRRGAETPVIKDAYMRIMARYDGARLDFELVHRCYQELAEIADAIEDAWAVLGDNDLRRRYLSAVSAKS
jgi:hypothetical protein